VGERRVERNSDVSLAIARSDPGDRVPVRIVRGDSERTVTVTLGTRPTAAP